MPCSSILVVPTHGGDDDVRVWPDAGLGQVQLPDYPGRRKSAASIPSRSTDDLEADRRCHGRERPDHRRATDDDEVRCGSRGSTKISSDPPLAHVTGATMTPSSRPSARPAGRGGPDEGFPRSGPPVPGRPRWAASRSRPPSPAAGHPRSRARRRQPAQRPECWPTRPSPVRTAAAGRRGQPPPQPGRRPVPCARARLST